MEQFKEVPACRVGNKYLKLKKLQKQCASGQQKASHSDVINAGLYGISLNKVAFRNIIPQNKHLIFNALSFFEEALIRPTMFPKPSRSQ